MSISMSQYATMNDHIDALRAENEALKAAMTEWQRNTVDYIRIAANLPEYKKERSVIDAIASGVEIMTAPSLERGREIVRDAERYRWLRDAGASIGGIDPVRRNKWLDAAIDAAREAKHG